MKLEQITSAGTHYGSNQTSTPVKEIEPKKEFQTQDVFVVVGDEKIKIGEYPRQTEEQVEESVKNINKELRSMETNLKFSIHKQTKQIMVKIVDSTTSKVIKEVPSEKMLDMVAAMMERAGLLMDKRG